MDKEELLLEENAQLKQELDILRQATQTGIWILHFDEEGRNVGCTWGESFRQLLGYESEEDFPTERFSLVNAIHPEDRDRAENALHNVIMDRTDKLTYDEEFRVQTKNNGYQWFHSIGRVARREDGSPKTMYGMFANINDKKTHELHIRQQMRVIEALSKDYASVWLLQPSHNVILYRQDTQRDIQEVVDTLQHARNVIDGAKAYAQTFLKPEDRNAFLQALQYDNIYEQVKQNGTYSYSYIRYYEGKEEHFIVSFTRTHDFDSSGDIVMSFKNIESLYQEEYERTRALEANKAELQEALKEKEEHIKQTTALNTELKEEKRTISQTLGIIDGLSRDYHTIWLVNKDTLMMKLIRTSGVSTISKAVQMGIDYPNYDDAFPVYINTYVVEDEREKMMHDISSAEVLRNLSLSDTYSVNYLRRDENGHVAYHQLMYINADTEDGERLFVYGFRDIDKMLKEERSKKQELADARRAAEAASKSKTIFLNNMSHDIRTPMNAILGFAELMEGQKNNPEIISNYLKKIKDSGQYLLTIINNVLDMARIESGKMTVTHEFFDMTANGNVAFPMFEDMARKKRLNIVHHEDIQHRYVMLDKTKHLEIATNLLSNAVKYTPEGGTIYVSMTERPCQREGYGTYVLTVQDTGIGMSPEFAEHIFENFTREHNTTESKIIGTGLGMSIVKKLVELLGGTIEMQTEQGKGTTFTVTMYHKIVSDPTPYLHKDDDVKNNEQILKGKRILLTEDNELNAEIVIAILESLDIEIEHAENGQECLDMLTKADPHYYDAILMDIQMPVLNGYDTTRLIRKMDDPVKSAIPIVALTANAFEEDRQKAIEAGMNTHLAKPINVEKLIEVLLLLTKGE